MQALVVITPILCGLALFGIAWWLERATRRPGLMFFIGGVALLAGASVGFVGGKRLLPLVFLVQAIGSFYSAHWRRTNARAAAIAKAERR